MNLDPFVLAKQVEDWLPQAMSQMKRQWRNGIEHVWISGIGISRSSIYGISDDEMREALIGYALQRLYLELPLPEIQKNGPRPEGRRPQEGRRGRS